ncbi:MAG: MOSC domain-containing protein [Woeseia sp.]|nr:MOSC domain-containing protein [Woeseia sp.]MBT8097047.1 MOSC domain-containing protein [Woeseia sp.]NNE60296.1 MOSC domain-containing protein [Woeseia sp.]NNL55958.1 MOSC domain-containing protein [Woeseia sp.]
MGRLCGIARRSAKRAAMETLTTAEISSVSGVADDFRGRPGKRQVTVISKQAWQAACRDLGTELPWTTRRANLFVEEMELPRRTGDVLQIGDVELRVTMEVDPCPRMDEQHEGLRKALSPEWRGGVACTVLHGGTVAIGDAVRLRADD